MPKPVQWEADFSVGHALVDAQHQALLTQCNLLADLCPAGAAAAIDQQFDQAFDRLKALVREHFDTEAAWLAGCGGADLEDHRFELEEFEYLAGEIATAENFDRVELQRFLALWCLGHIKGMAAQQRAYRVGGDAAS